MPQAEPFCPYLGLEFYTEDYHDYFFGREEDQETIGANLATTPLTILYGASGVGKTSVLLAGVVPFLRNLSNMIVIVFREWHDSGFLSHLKAKIVNAASVDLGQSFTPEEISLDDLLAQVASATHSTVTVIFDQFEEYFLKHPEVSRDNLFETEFARAVNRDDVHANFLISIREDNLSLLDRFQGRISNLFSNYLRLEHLDTQAAEQAIRKPLEKYRELYTATDGPTNIEDKLVKTILNDKYLRPGRLNLGQTGVDPTQWSADLEESADNRIEAPFLQLVLRRLWYSEITQRSQILQSSTLEQLQGIKTILQNHLDETMSKLSDEDREISSHVFNYLATPSGMKIPIASTDLEQYTEYPTDRIERVLERLDNERILRSITSPFDQATTKRYEIYHDVLTPSIQAWARQFRDRQLRKQAQTEIKRWRGIAISAIIILFAFGVLAYYANQQKGKADNLRKIAIARDLASEAEQILDRLDQSPTILLRATLLATESLRRYSTIEGQQILDRCLALLPQEIAKIQDESEVSVVAFSPKEQLAASGSSKGTIRIWDATSKREIAQMKHLARITSISFSPDSRYLASSSFDNTARVWEVASGREVVRLPHQGSVNIVAFHPKGKWVASGADDKKIRIWEANTGRELVSLKHGASVNSLAFSPNGNLLASGSEGGAVQVWETSTWHETARFKHRDKVNAVAFRFDGQRLVSASQDSTVRIWDLNDRRMLHLLQHADNVSTLAFAPDGRSVASGSWDKTARVWNAETGSEIVRVKHDDKITAVAFSPNGELVASGSWDYNVRIWKAENGQEVSRMAHGFLVTTLEFSRDGRRIVTGSSDATARIWEMPKGREITCITHEKAALAAAFSLDGKSVISGSKDNLIRVWDAGSGFELLRTAHQDSITLMAINPNKWRAASANDETIRVWEIITDRELVRITHEAKVTSMVFSPEGQRFASGGMDSTIRVWDATKWNLVDSIRSEARVTTLTFAPDGSMFAVGGSNDAIQIWEMKSKRPVNRFAVHNSITSVAFSMDGKWLACGSVDSTVHVWEIETGHEIAQLSHDAPVTAIAFSPFRTWLAAGSDDNTLRVWEIATKSELARIKHEGTLTAISFSADAKWLLSAGTDKTARLWLWQPEHLRTEACTRLSRNLTRKEWQQYLGDETYCQTCPNLPPQN